MTETLKDPHGHVRQEAAAAVAKIQGTPAPEAVDPSTGDPVIWGHPLRYWIAAMRKADGDPDDRDFEEWARACRALEKLGVKSVPALLESLKGDLDTRFQAIMILQSIEDPAGLDLLAKSLKHEDVRIRRGAAEALAPAGLGELPPADPKSRPYEESILRALTDALNDGDAEVRRSAARALGRREAVMALGPLAAALANDPDPQVRVSAARSLGIVGARSQEALEALRAAAKEGPASVRDAAAEALVAHGEAAPAVEDPAAALRELVEKEGNVEEKEAKYSEVTRTPGDADTVVFVLANGGSNGREFPRTKEMVARMIDALPPEARFGVVFYSARIARYPEDGKPARAEGKAKEAGIEFVRTATKGSGSCVQLGFEAAFDMMEAAAAMKFVIIYAGNGSPTCPGKDHWAVYQKETLEEIARRNGGRGAIHAFAGGEYNASFLKPLAGMNGGTFTRLIP